MKKIIISLCSLAFITTLTSCAVPLQELGDNSKKAIDNNVLTDAIKNKVVSFFSSNSIEFDTEKTYGYSTGKRLIVDAVSSNYRYTKISDSLGKVLSETYYKKSGNYAVEQYLDITNTVLEKNVTDKNGNQVAFDTLTGNPFSFLTLDNIGDYFIASNSDDGLILTPTGKGQGRLNSSFASFFSFDDSYTFDGKTLSEYVEDFKLLLSEDGTPSRMMFNMVKKDMFGGLRETYVTDLSLIEDVLTMKPVEAKATGDSFTRLNNAMTSLKNDMAKGNYTVSFTVDQWDQNTSSPSYSNISYNSYYQFDNETHPVMLSDLKLYDSTHGTTYIGVAQASNGSYQWIGVSPSSNYISAIDDNSYDEPTSFLPTVGSFSPNFFAVNGDKYTFDIENLIQADHTFQVGLLTGLTGSADYLSQKYGNYVANASTMKFDFKTLDIELDGNKVKDFVLTYGGVDGRDHKLTISYSNFGTTDISKVDELSQAYKVLTSSM